MKISVLTAYFLAVSCSSNPNWLEMIIMQSLMGMANFILFDFILFYFILFYLPKESPIIS
jgi:hypothetical protein